MEFKSKKLGHNFNKGNYIFVYYKSLNSPILTELIWHYVTDLGQFKQWHRHGILMSLIPVFTPLMLFIFTLTCFSNYLGRERTFDCKLYWYPKLYEHVLLFFGLKSIGTFLKFWLVGSYYQYPNFSIINSNVHSLNQNRIAIPGCILQESKEKIHETFQQITCR